MHIENEDAVPIAQIKMSADGTKVSCSNIMLSVIATIQIIHFLQNNSYTFRVNKHVLHNLSKQRSKNRPSRILSNLQVSIKYNVSHSILCSLYSRGRSGGGGGGDTELSIKVILIHQN